MTKNLGKIFFLLISLQAFAFADTTVHLCDAYIVDKSEPFYYGIKVVVSDAGELVKLKQEVTSVRSQKVESVNVFDSDDLFNGILLYQQEGHEVLTMSSPDLDTFEGGSIDFEYLSNGLVGSTKKASIKIENKKGQWQLTRKGRRFTRINIHKKKILGQVVGISQLDFK